MSTLTPTYRFTPEDVARASTRDAKHYELIEGELKEKVVGTKALFIAFLICERFNAMFWPHWGFSVVEAMVYCFDRPNHGRKPDVALFRLDRFADRAIPEGDLRVAPDVAVEALSASNTGIEIEEKLNEYLAAGVSMVWIVNPERRTIRVYRNDGTTRLFHADEIIANEPLLPGFSVKTGDVFPPTT